MILFPGPRVFTLTDYELRLRPLSEKREKQIYMNNIMKNNLAVVIHENVKDITM